MNESGAVNAELAAHRFVVEPSEDQVKCEPRTHDGIESAPVKDAARLNTEHGRDAELGSRYFGRPGVRFGGVSHGIQ